MVMVYWPQALGTLFGRAQAAKMGTAVEEAIAYLAVVFPPPRPNNSGVRDQHFERVLRKYGAGNFGVYHFARWVAIGQNGVKDSVLSQDLISTGTHLNNSWLFYSWLNPLIQAISLLFQVVDPQMHLHYLHEYRYSLF